MVVNDNEKKELIKDRAGLVVGVLNELSVPGDGERGIFGDRPPSFLPLPLLIYRELGVFSASLSSISRLDPNVRFNFQQIP